MDPSLIAVIITSGASLLGVTVLFIRGHLSENKSMRFKSRQEDIMRYHSQLARINKYREPLIQACLDLYHYLQAVFYRDRNGLETERDKLEMLYAFAQLFGWIEIVRRELLEFNFDDAKLNMDIRTALGSVYTAFEDANYLSDNSFHQTYMEQRALGELMLDDKHTCIDYTTFISHMNDPGFNNWFRGLKNSLTSLELSLPQFLPETYYGIQHGELHAWSEDYKAPGICETCGGNKSAGHHRGDITAHFYRLYRIYNAIITLAKTLDFEKKRVQLKTIAKPVVGNYNRFIQWLKPKVIPTDNMTIIVDRIRHDFVTRIVGMYQHNSNPSSRGSLNKRPSTYDLSAVVEKIDILLKLRDSEKIIKEEKVQILTSIEVDELKRLVNNIFEKEILELGWNPSQILLSSIAVRLDMNMCLTQYGLRSGSIIYVSYPTPVNRSGDNTPVTCHNPDEYKIEIDNDNTALGEYVAGDLHELALPIEIKTD
jgi:hypothetical protein